MKKLLFILTLFLISIAGSSQDYFEGISGLKFLSSDTVNVFNDFIFKGDTIKKDSLVYVEIKPDSIRFKYINGVFTSWIKISNTENVQLSPASAQSGFSDLTSYKLNGVNIFGSQTTNRISYWDGTKFVSITDGTNGQALATNGSGVYSFTDVGGYEINTPQALSGTSVTWDLNNGMDATITLTGNTTITISNATDGVTGTLWVTNAASVYTITFAGYTNAIDPFIRLAANMVITSGGSKSDDFTFKYNGVKMNWNGTLNRE